MKVTGDELMELLERLGTPAGGRRLVEEARLKAPVREVQAHGHNLVVTFRSRKMERLLEVESSRTEFPRTVLLEDDPDVLEYLPQPCRLDLSYSPPGIERPIRVQHTPDFLVLRRHRLVLEEWKEESRLLKLSATQPYRYVKQPDGTWTSPPLVAHCQALGIDYELHSAAELPRRYVENVLFMRDYLDEDCPALDTGIRQQLQRLLQDEPVRHLHDLVHGHGFRSDDIFRAIAEGVVFADLEDERLADTRRVRVFRDETVRHIHRLAALNAPPALPIDSQLVIEPGTRLVYEGEPWEVALVGSRKVTLQQDQRSVEVQTAHLEKLHRAGSLTVAQAVQPDPETLRLHSATGLADLSAETLRETVRRIRVLSDIAGGRPMPGVSERTLRRWKAKRSVALIAGGNEALALAPDTHRRGNRATKLPEAVLALANGIIRDEYLQNSAPNASACFMSLKAACEARGLQAPSLKSFTALTHRVKQAEKTFARQGRRAAYQQREFFWRLEYDTPVHGVRPWDIVHIDHTELDIELLSSVTGEPLGRPWATLAIDAYSRRIVGMYLTFEPPSHRSVMMILRDMVRRYGRVPANLVLDRGREFISGYLDLVIEVLGCTRKLRPGANPRVGSVCERLFGTTNTTFVHNLAGNTKITKMVRTATKSVMPKNLAEWTLEPLYFALEAWAFDLYDQKPHPALGISPRQAYERGLVNTGMREHRLWRYDRDFLVLTCPTPPRQGADRKIELQRGVRINEDYYWSPVFSNPLVAGQSVPVRYDPWDIRHAFAYVGGRWEQCISRRYGLLDDYSSIELRTALEEYKRITHGTRLTELPAETIREWLKIRDPRNFEDVLAQRHAAARKLYSALGMSSVAQFDHLGQPAEPLPTFDEVAVTIPMTTKPPVAAPAEPTPTILEDSYDTF